MQSAHSKASIQHVFSPRRDWVAVVRDTYAMCIHAWHQTGGGLYVTHHEPESLVQELSAAKCYLIGGKRQSDGLSLCLGQLFGVSILQVAPKDLSGCGEALVCKAQHYCSTKRNVIGIWD